jgi:hypothetical protein
MASAVWMLAFVLQILVQFMVWQPMVGLDPDECNPRELAFRGVAVAFFELLSSGPARIINAITTPLGARRSVGVISLVVSNTYVLLRTVGGSAFTAALLSLLLIFDQATIDLIEQDAGFAVQLVLVQVALSASGQLMQCGLASPDGAALGVVAAGGIFLATCMRYEVWPAGIPLLVLVIGEVFGSARVSFFSRLGAIIGRIFSLTAIAGATVVLACLVLFTFGLPRYEREGMTVEAVLVELTTNHHNLALFGVTALAVALWLLSTVPQSWVWCFVLAALGVVAQPLSCLANDWIIRVVLARYLLLVASGFVVCTAPAVLASPFILVLESACAIFYAHPVQAPTLLPSS